MRKKRLLSEFLYRSGGLSIGHRILRRLSRPLMVLAYHRVLPEWTDEFNGDLELISASSAEFLWQMRFVRRHFDLLTPDDLIAAATGRQSLPKKPLLVTFDDGFVDNVQHALPILTEVGVPATFFVATGYIGTSQRYWYDKVVADLVKTTRPTLDVDAIPPTLRTVPETNRDRRQLAADLLLVMKTLSHQERRRSLEALAALHGGAAAPADDAHRPMTWDEVRDISNLGMAIGSHSVSHPILASLDNAELDHELRSSKALIEQETGGPCRTLSYPVGGLEDIDDRVVTAATDSGYQLGFTYISRAQPRDLNDPLQLSRLHVERYMSRAEFAAMLAYPELATYPTLPKSEQLARRSLR